MTVNFYYLRGAFYGNKRLLEQHGLKVADLLQGNIGIRDVELLHDGICSLRLNEKERLLFTTEEVGGQTYLSVLEYLPTHDYQKSRFLRSGVLRDYKLRNKAIYEGLAAEQKKTPEEEFNIRIANARDAYKIGDGKGHPEVLDYYQNQIISLNLEQKTALNLSLPAVLSGVAGSGKSLVALTMIANYLDSIPSKPRCRVLYHLMQVTDSKNFCSV
jgi:hypothetical protein